MHSQCEVLMPWIFKHFSYEFDYNFFVRQHRFASKKYFSIEQKKNFSFIPSTLKVHRRESRLSLTLNTTNEQHLIYAILTTSNNLHKCIIAGGISRTQQPQRDDDDIDGWAIRTLIIKSSFYSIRVTCRDEFRPTWSWLSAVIVLAHKLDEFFFWKVIMKSLLNRTTL